MIKNIVVQHNDVIEKGATFYREVYTYSDVDRLVPYAITDKTIRARLMNSITGAIVANFSCAQLTSADSNKFAWTMPRDTTSGLTSGSSYFYNIDLDDYDGVTTDRIQSGKITVNKGQTE